jgi:hypothetical protein
LYHIWGIQKFFEKHDGPLHNADTTITVPLFDQEMQYLHDNGFNPTNNVFYLKNISSSNETSNATTLNGAASYSIAIAK